MKAYIPQIRWKHKRIVENPLLRLGAGSPKTVLILGHLAKVSARDLILVAVKVRMVYMEYDIVTEFVVEDHFAEGWRSFTTFFPDEIFAGNWDVILTQAEPENEEILGRAVNNVLQSLKHPISGRELWTVPCLSQPPQAPESIFSPTLQPEFANA